MLHYLFANTFFSSVSESRQAIKCKNIKVRHQRPQEATSVLTKIILLLNVTLKSSNV